MKTYTIGRDTNSHIQFSDPQISRRHALIKVYPFGKMELVDMSTNGTYVNGVRISSNKSIPITRKDSVVFAHVGQLDWHDIPNPLKWIYYLGAAFAALVIIIMLCLYIPKVVDFSSDTDDIELGSSIGGSGSSSTPSSPSTPGQGQVSPDNGNKDVEKEGESWDQKILNEERRKKEKKSSKEKRNQEKGSNQGVQVENIIY